MVVLLYVEMPPFKVEQTQMTIRFRKSEWDITTRCKESELVFSYLLCLAMHGMLLFRQTILFAPHQSLRKGQTIISLLIRNCVRVRFVGCESIMWQHNAELQSKIDNHTILPLRISVIFTLTKWLLFCFFAAVSLSLFLRWFYGKTCPHIFQHNISNFIIIFNKNVRFSFLSFSVRIARNLCALFFCLF